MLVLLFSFDYISSFLLYYSKEEEKGFKCFVVRESCWNCSCLLSFCTEMLPAAKFNTYHRALGGETKAWSEHIVKELGKQVITRSSYSSGLTGSFLHMVKPFSIFYIHPAVPMDSINGIIESSSVSAATKQEYLFDFYFSDLNLNSKFSSLCFYLIFLLTGIYSL